MTSGAPPEGLEVQSSLRELSGLLWRERVALDRLADHLVAGDADVDCDGIYHSISALELHRAIAAREAAVELGVDGEPTLQQLVKAAPLGWADVLMSHRRALVDLTNEITHLVRRPVVDLTDTQRDGDEPAVDLRPSGVRRNGVQRSLREFLA
ncbi:MAG TPA: hypothetical protein VM345_16945 [Acidimicrobiales bacterium]|nr:hypothetical protein [Acidimicrobiales bacterium]